MKRFIKFVVLPLVAFAVIANFGDLRRYIRIRNM